MKKVGIVSCYFKNNYGSMLQAYATQKFLDDNKIPNETISIEKNIDFKKGKRKYYLSQLTNLKFFKTKFGMIKLKIDKKMIRNLEKNINVRNLKYQEFRKKIRLSKKCKTYSGLSEMALKEYNDVIVGSDQLWLPVNVIADYYTLNWVPDNINKISYATSFGVSNVPRKYYKKYECFLRRINHLSLREKSGIQLVKEIANVNGELVCDPTILLTKEEWEDIAISEKIINEKYILCYFLGNNVEHRKFAERLREKTGYKIVSLNHADEYVKYSDVFADISPYDIGPKEWINLIKNAEYVCTDSFHGTVFSVLFNKYFFCFKRYRKNNGVSTNGRIDSLLHEFGISTERILSGNENVEEILKYNINYSKVNKKVSDFRLKSQTWLLRALSFYEQDKNEKSYIQIKDKDLCCGCTACASVCPVNAIEMIKDEEGFLYPKVDEIKCIKCGACKKTCPILNQYNKKSFRQKGYIFQYNNDKIRKESTSGGFFTAIAEEIILKKNGVVYGVSFDDSFKAIHMRVDKINDLYKFRNSKYVQSDPNSTFRQVKKDLLNKRVVLYSGTTCQIEGLLNYLKDKYDNLYTVDVVCRAVPSPLLWEKYLNYRKENRKIKKVFFREKKHGYKYSNLTMYDENGEFYNNGIDSDPYLRAFFSNIACRPSCYNCQFKSKNHRADFTIWDCFEVEKFDKSFDDDKGTTRVLVNSCKGSNLFNDLKQNHKSREINIDLLVSNFYQMFHSIKYNSKRKQFFEDLNNEDFDKVLCKYFPNKIKNKLEKYGRIVLIKLRIYKPLMKLGKKIRKRN